MKRMRINAGKVGLRFRNGDFKGVITEGVNWIGLLEDVYVYDQSVQFQPMIDLNILIRESRLREMLELVEVGDSELALLYADGNFKEILKPGRYAFWKGLNKFTFRMVDLAQPSIPDDIDISVISRNAFIPFVLSCTIASFENGLLFVDNRFVKRLEPGKYLFWKTLKEPTVLKVDLRQIQMEISGQEMLTADKAALRMNFFVRYQVVDVVKAVQDNKDFEKQLYVLVQLALREFVGNLSLDELLDSKQQVTANVLKSVGAKSNELGVQILDAGVKDIILPGDVKEIMNRVLVAQKQAQANVITRREETASTRSMLNTAKIMEENEMLFKLKEMEYVEKIAEKIGDITVSGNGHVLTQLKDIFSVK